MSATSCSLVQAAAVGKPAKEAKTTNLRLQQLYSLPSQDQRSLCRYFLYLTLHSVEKAHWT